MINPIDIVGNKFTNNSGQEFIVLEYIGLNKHKQHIYSVQFIISGYLKTNIQRNNLLNGKIKDRLAPTVCGVGILGVSKKSDNVHIYNVWVNMLKRCYDVNCPAYKYYGGQNVSVCERWKRLDFFTTDLVLIPGWDKKLFEKGILKLDKDLNKGNCYSLENCIFVTHLENMKEATARYNSTKSRKIVIYPNGKKELITNLSDFCKDNNINYRSVYYVLNNEIDNIKGYKFYYE